jgi:SAM-dependent methyltransferase
LDKVREEEWDAYGQEIWDYYKKEYSYEVIERDDGYVNSSVGSKLYFAPYEKWHRIEKNAIRYAKGRVLDVGCGAGRVGIYLQNQKKLDVLGIDNSPLAIRVTKLRGVRKTRLLDFHAINFPFSSFDSVVMFGNNFGLFSNRNRARFLLKRLFRMTSENAVIICESLDPYITDDPAHIAYQRKNKKRSRMGGQVRIRVRYRRFVGKWFDYLLVSKKELQEIIKGTGWRIERFFDATERPVYVAILRKDRMRN